MDVKRYVHAYHSPVNLLYGNGAKYTVCCREWRIDCSYHGPPVLVWTVKWLGQRHHVSADIGNVSSTCIYDNDHTSDSMKGIREFLHKMQGTISLICVCVFGDLTSYTLILGQLTYNGDQSNSLHTSFSKFSLGVLFFLSHVIFTLPCCHLAWFKFLL